jgi:hypothetical protein
MQILARNSQGTFRILRKFYIKSQHRTTEVLNDAGMLALVRKGNGCGYLNIPAGPRCWKVAGLLRSGHVKSAVGTGPIHQARMEEVPRSEQRGLRLLPRGPTNTTTRGCRAEPERRALTRLPTRRNLLLRYWFSVQRTDI